MTHEMQKYRERMIAEWTVNVCRKYGSNVGPQRITTLMHLYYESDVSRRFLKPSPQLQHLECLFSNIKIFVSFKD